MKYRKDKYGNEVSQLGFGCMRFTGVGPKIDYTKAEKEIMTAFEAGVNYYDTAYLYPGSEELIGKIFESNGIRDKVRIATKLPHYLVKKTSDFDKYFDEQLRRLRTDHVEYYLMHMINDAASWKRLVDLGALEWLAEKKASGQIEQVGFSYHGNSETFCALLDVYDWDFCQIQYNYLDEHSQAGRKGLLYAHEKGLPVVIMEPLRGGKLVSRLPEEAKRIFAGYEIKRTPAQWAFRWLYNQAEVTCVLSGMNSMEMVKDNIETACAAAAGEMSVRDHEMLSSVVAAINAKMKVGCTGCGYCMPCPKNVDIRGAFAAYNRRYAEGKFWGTVDYAICTALRKTSTAASNCVGCGKCEAHCPQGIPIREKLKEVQKEFETPVYKAVRAFAGKIVKF
jgi:predicted aldo/keto reductase-like oxidoreductase